MATPPVSVIGLGAMGRALAAAFVRAGHPTTVWNRSPGRADELVAAGARLAPTVPAALEAGQLTVICLLDRHAVDAVIDAGGARWRGVPVVNLTSSTPAAARSTADRLTALGATYVDGAVMVTTEMVGTREAHVLYAGERVLFEQHHTTLAALGGTAELLGDDPGLAATYDLAMLDVFFAGMAAFLHAATLVGADGVPARSFVPYAKRMVALLDVTLDGLAADVDAGTHDGSADNLVMELAALEHIVDTTRERGLDTALPEAVRDLAAAAVVGGHGGDSFSRVVDVMRRPTGARPRAQRFAS